MLTILSRLSAAVLAACALASSPLTTLAAPHALHTSNASPRALYQQAFQSLRHVGRFQFLETAQVLESPSKTVQDAFRYTAPDRIITAVEVKPDHGQVLAVKSVQVGTTKCQTPPGWVCYHFARPDVVAEVRALLEPKLRSPSYRVVGGGKSLLTIEITGKSQRFSYVGSLTLGARDHLPRTIDGSIHQDQRLVVSQRVSFTYGGHYRIELPKGKGVHLPKP